MSFFDQSLTQSRSISTDSSLKVGRREVISKLSMFSTAFIASSLDSDAAWFGKSKTENLPSVNVRTVGRRPSQQIGGFPENWARLQGRNLNDYANYLRSLKLKNIEPQSVLMAHAKQRGIVWNMLPPKQYWTRMGYTLRVVDRISSEMKTPVSEIVSAYRSPKYNARCWGAKKHSWHLANVAVDVKFDTSPRNVATATRTLRDRGLFKGGVGRYYSFTHIDTRGQNVNW